MQDRENQPSKNSGSQLVEKVESPVQDDKNHSQPTCRFPNLERRLQSIEKCGVEALSAEAGRFGIYKYLERIIFEQARWKRLGKCRTRIRQIKQLRPRDLQANASPSTVLIAATSGLSPTLRSKWAILLEKAVKSGVSSDQFKQFVKTSEIRDSKVISIKSQANSRDEEWS